jgi:hypothetical protein
MKDNTKETSEATSSHAKSSRESYRKEADRLTKAHKTSEQTLRGKVERHLKSGNSSLSEVDVKVVLSALAKGEKISPEGTIPLVGDPRRWGGMSGEGSSSQVDFSEISREERCYMLADRMFERFGQHDKHGSAEFQDIRGFMLKHPMNEIEYDKYFLSRFNDITKDSADKKCARKLGKWLLESM